MAKRKRGSSRLGKKRGSGQPAFEPTAEHRLAVKVMASMGATHAKIALAVINPNSGAPIDEKSLRKHFRRELDSGHAEVEVIFGVSMVSLMKKQNITALIWYSKNRMGWRDSPDDRGGLASGGVRRIEISGGLPPEPIEPDTKPEPKPDVKPEPKTEDK